MRMSEWRGFTHQGGNVQEMLLSLLPLFFPPFSYACIHIPKKMDNLGIGWALWSVTASMRLKRAEQPTHAKGS